MRCTAVIADDEAKHGDQVCDSPPARISCGPADGSRWRSPEEECISGRSVILHQDLGLRRSMQCPAPALCSGNSSHSRYARVSHVIITLYFHHAVMLLSIDAYSAPTPLPDIGVSLQAYRAFQVPTTRAIATPAIANLQPRSASSIAVHH